MTVTLTFDLIQIKWNKFILESKFVLVMIKVSFPERGDLKTKCLQFLRNDFEALSTYHHIPTLAKVRFLSYLV